MISIAYNKGLPKELRQTLQNRGYAPQEVAALHAAIKKDYEQKKLGFRRAALTMGVVFVLMIVLTVVGSAKRAGAGSMPMAGMMAGLLAACAAVLVFLWLNLVQKNKRQFVAALRRGYPELEEELGEDSFRPSASPME